MNFDLSDLDKLSKTAGSRPSKFGPTAKPRAKPTGRPAAAAAAAAPAAAPAAPAAAAGPAAAPPAAGHARQQATPQVQAKQAAAAGQQQQQQQQPEAPTLLLQHLLNGICASCGKGSGQHQHQQQQLSVNTVGDLAVALTELKPRVDAYAIWSGSSSASGAEQQQLAGADGTWATQEGSSGTGQEDSLPVQLQAQMAAAVDALAAAAWQHAGSPGALEVRDVSRLLLAFCQLQVSCPQVVSCLHAQACSSLALLGP